MQDVIKEFLISLGFKVDDSSLNTATKAMKVVETAVASFASKSITSFAKAEAGVIAFVVAANVAIGKFIIGLGQADLQTIEFAQKMWMGVDAARAYQNSLDALGVSVQDLYLSPELMAKYQELNKLSREMAVPSRDYEGAMKSVRDITFEFQKLKLESTVALQWIGFYLTKYLAGPMGDLKKWLTNINDTIQKNMPVWTARIAQVTSWVVRLGEAIWSIKGALLGVTAVFVGFKVLTSPIAMLILGMTALLLLVDDYRAFENDKSGKNSVFNDLWKWVDGIGDKLRASGLGFDTFKKDLLGIAGSVVELVKSLKSLGEKGGLKEDLQNGIIGALTQLDDLLTSINKGIKLMNDLVTGKTTVPDAVKGAIKSNNGALEAADAANPNAFSTKMRGWEKSVGGYLQKHGADEQDEQNKIKDFFAGIGGFLGNVKSSLFGSGISPMSYQHTNDQYGNIMPINIQKMQKGIERIASMMSYNNPSGGTQMSYLYPQSTTSHATQISFKPVYNINGATQPQAVASTVNGVTTAAFTRFFQGVNR